MGEGLECTRQGKARSKERGGERAESRILMALLEPRGPANTKPAVSVVLDQTGFCHLEPQTYACLSGKLATSQRSKSRSANAILSASLAVTMGAAKDLGLPLRATEGAGALPRLSLHPSL